MMRSCWPTRQTGLANHQSDMAGCDRCMCLGPNCPTACPGPCSPAKLCCTAIQCRAAKGLSGRSAGHICVGGLVSPACTPVAALWRLDAGCCPDIAPRISGTAHQQAGMPERWQETSLWSCAAHRSPGIPAHGSSRCRAFDETGRRDAVADQFAWSSAFECIIVRTWP